MARQGSLRSNKPGVASPMCRASNVFLCTFHYASVHGHVRGLVQRAVCLLGCLYMMMEVHRVAMWFVGRMPSETLHFFCTILCRALMQTHISNFLLLLLETEPMKIVGCATNSELDSLFKKMISHLILHGTGTILIHGLLKSKTKSTEF